VGREPEGRRPFGRPRRRSEYNIKVGITEMECLVVEWNPVAQERKGACGELL
jgi:hypothetical protein